MARQKKPQKRIEPVFDGGTGKSRAPEVHADGARTSTKSVKGKATAAGKTARRAKPRRKKSGSGIWRFFGRTVYWSMVAGVWIAIAGVCVIAWHAMQLPQTEQWAIPDRPPNARIVAVDGELLANRGATGGAATRLSEMSPYIPMAVVAIEDHRFKSHFGVDPLGLARAMTRNALAGRFVQGGSTLTQQLAKNLFLKPERTLSRKIQEAVLALWLETRFSKDEILELYLNRVYFGSGAYGVDAASRRYFGKSARDVNLAEAAIIAGVLKAPSRLSPARNKKAADARAELVLAAMRREGFITDRESAAALTMQAKTAKRYWSGSEHYVADMVMKRVKALVGEFKGDIVVDTSIDMDLQQFAGTAISDALKKSGKTSKVSQGALVALDGTGAIRALVGGAEYADSQFNRAVDAKRQPGSAFKPFVYLAALEAGREPTSIRNDARVKIGKWTPENYDRKYRGPVRLDDALAGSLNTIAAQLVMETGPKNVIGVARRLGINSKLKANASIALGTSETSLLELTNAYAPLANGGYRAEPYLIRRITNDHGDVLYERKSSPHEKVVSARELGMMNFMMRKVVTSGTGKNARVKGWPVGGKTGTSQNSRDAWFVGYTANLTTGVWFGNDDGKPMKKVTGGGLPARTFARFMTKAHENVPVASLPGRYHSTLAAVPTARPVINAGVPKPQQIHEVERGEGRALPQDTRTGSIRPSQEVGGSRKKPRTIMDLLFGKNG